MFFQLFSIKHPAAVVYNMIFSGSGTADQGSPVIAISDFI